MINDPQIGVNIMKIALTYVEWMVLNMNLWRWMSYGVVVVEGAEWFGHHNKSIVEFECVKLEYQVVDFDQLFKGSFLGF